MTWSDDRAEAVDAAKRLAAMVRGLRVDGFRPALEEGFDYFAAQAEGTAKWLAKIKEPKKHA